MFDEFLARVCSALNKNQIPYMLSGGAALGFHAVSRTTRDLDIVVQLKLTDIDILLSEFKDFYYSRPTIEEEIKKKGIFNLIDAEAGFKIDFILAKDTDYARSAFNRRKRHELKGTYFWIISLEDLIINKFIWAQDYESDRQLSDIRSLLANANVDNSYLSYWIKKLHLKTYGLVNQ